MRRISPADAGLRFRAACLPEIPGFACAVGVGVILWGEMLTWGGFAGPNQAVSSRQKNVRPVCDPVKNYVNMAHPQVISAPKGVAHLAELRTDP